MVCGCQVMRIRPTAYELDESASVPRPIDSSAIIQGADAPVAANADSAVRPPDLRNLT